MTPILNGTTSRDGLRQRSQHRSKPLVLIVEDHEDTRELFRIVMESSGCSVAEAGDGEEALRLARSLKPDLILMDTDLPIVDGLAVTRRLRNSAVTSNVPIIFVSGHVEPELRFTALAIGGNEFFDKPVNLSELESAVIRQLGKGSNLGV